MGEGIKMGAGGGYLKVTNGLLEQHRAKSGEIKPNTLVELIKSEGYQFFTPVKGWYEPGMVKVCLLEKNKVLAVCRSSGTYPTTEARVITYDPVSNVLNLGTIVSIGQGSDSKTSFDIVTINSNKVVYATPADTSLSTKVPRAYVLSISGSTITVETPLALTGYEFGFEGVQLSVCTDGKVLMLGRDKTYAASDSVYTFLTISGTSLSASTPAIIAMPNPPDAYSHLSNLGDDKFILVGTTQIVFFTRSGTSLTKSTALAMPFTKTSGKQIQPALMPDGSVFLGGEGGSSPAYSTFACLIDTKGSVPTIISSINKVLYNDSLKATYYARDSAIRYGNMIYCPSEGGIGVFKVVDSKIVPVTFFTLTGFSDLYASMTLLGNLGFCLAAHRIYDGGNYNGWTVLDFDKMQMLALPSVNKVDGITKTKCSQTQLGDVWVARIGG